MASDLLNQALSTVTQEHVDTHKRMRKKFGCKMCGVQFKAGSIKRWIYANGTHGACTGNFFVCGDCDSDDVLIRAIADYDKMKESARRWGMWGPDWQGGHP